MSIPSSEPTGGAFAWGDAESTIARVREQMAETLERAERAQALKGQIGAVRGKSKSPRGEVEVEVDATGRLIGITFTDDAAELAPAELSRSVLGAVAKAQRLAGDQAIALTADIFGENSETVGMLRAEIDERMPDLPNETSLGYRP
ncbi:hypothetical protein BH11ACT3_BH11ACT3_12390 [soil metagenome]